MQNANPTIFETCNYTIRQPQPSDYDDSVKDAIDRLEVFNQIRNINDPEHPLTLEQLNVVQLDHINIDECNSLIHVQITPTIPHCSMATMIGLSVMVKLMRSFGLYWKYRVTIFPGTHQNEHAINKQLNDKERVSAAIENRALLSAINAALTPMPSSYPL